jgi:hypothetical protein
MIQPTQTDWSHIRLYVNRFILQKSVLNKAGRSVSGNGDEKPHIGDLNQYSSLLTALFTCLCTINSSTLNVGIIASLCNLPNSPS